MLKSLFSDNPLLIEYKRAVRRFFGVSKHSAANAVVLVISCMLYGLLLLITIANRSAMSPVSIIYLQTALFCFMIPANLHGAIAGERERRSWDLLLAAPITNMQIVVGKMMSGLAAVATAVALMFPPLLISLAGDADASIWKILKAEAISLGFAIALSSVVIFISARSKRTYSAHLMSYAAIMTGLVVYLVFVMVAGGQEAAPALLFLHPFYAITMVWWPDSKVSPVLYNGIFHFLAYIGIAMVMLLITVETLQVADGAEGRTR